MATTTDCAEFRIPRMTGDLAADERSLSRARRSARTEQQRRAVALRFQMLQERRQSPVSR